jgi:hypothetical protein
MTRDINHAHRVSDVRQVEIYTTEPLVSQPNPFEAEIAIANMESYKLPDMKFRHNWFKQVVKYYVL